MELDTDIHIDINIDINLPLQYLNPASLWGHCNRGLSTSVGLAVS